MTHSLKCTAHCTHLNMSYITLLTKITSGRLLSPEHRGTRIRDKLAFTHFVKKVPPIKVKLKKLSSIKYQPKGPPVEVVNICSTHPATAGGSEELQNLATSFFNRDLNFSNFSED